jgi:hypothetical protein
MLPFTVKKLCSPAYVYFVVAAVAYAAAFYQNLRNKTTLALGKVRCAVPSCAVLFALKAAYIVFWAYVLNLICKDGHAGFAWFLVVLPFVSVLAAIVAVSAFQKKQRAIQKAN